MEIFERTRNATRANKVGIIRITTDVKWPHFLGDRMYETILPSVTINFDEVGLYFTKPKSILINISMYMLIQHGLHKNVQKYSK